MEIQGTSRNLALFDLDNTLIAGDSDHAWGEFLVAKGLVDAKEYKRQNDAFYVDYQQGQLDVEAYLSFVLQPLTVYTPEEIHSWREIFLQEVIQPLRLPAAEELLEKHRQQGDKLVIITATNSFITRPIADLLGVKELIAPEPEIVQGLYTGKIVGIPSFGIGKVLRLQQWLKNTNLSLENSWFYSDSHNDLPLLEQVANPVAVDPDAQLQQEAKRQGWRILSLRG